MSDSASPTTSVVLTLLALGSAGCAFLAFRLRKPPPAGVFCASCSYSLAGIESASCPECKSTNRRVEPSPATLLLRVAKSIWWWTCAVVLFGVPVSAMAIAAFGRDRYTDVHTELWPITRHYDAATVDWRLDEDRPDTSPPQVTVKVRSRGVEASVIVDPRAPLRAQVDELAGKAGVDTQAAADDGTLDELARVASEAAAGQRFVLATKRHTQAAMSSASSSASRPWVIVTMLGVLSAGWAVGLWALFRRKPTPDSPEAPT